MSSSILIYLLRRDLRFADNPVFHDILKNQQKGSTRFTHLLPVYVFPAQQIEVSGFLRPNAGPCPFPEARSAVAGFWRCGPHRANFMAESVFSLKQSLEQHGSTLEIRVGLVQDVINDMLDEYRKEGDTTASLSVWMTGEEGVEEKREEHEVSQVAKSKGAAFKLWQDEKYFIDDRDVPLRSPSDLPNLFTAYRKKVEPLREAPRGSLRYKGDLPPPPDRVSPQREPFVMPGTLDEVKDRLCKPLIAKPDITSIAEWPTGAQSAHPYHGGEEEGHARIKHLIESGSMTTYKDTRNGMIGLDFSTKLSAWLALGCISARQIHEYLLDFEDARSPLGKGAVGYGKGENKGTGWVRFELLWRDYMRLCTRKHRHRLFRVEGFEDDKSWNWKHPNKDPIVKESVHRFMIGETGMGMIDASMRELWHTGWTSNRARQNCGSFLAKHLGIDWRIGAEWYESILVDYDVSSNWGNWQAVSITDRVFNPVKQSFDYDAKGEYVKLWVQELRKVDDVQCVFQAWKLSAEQQKKYEIDGCLYMENPLKRIQYGSANRGENSRRGGGHSNRNDRGRGNRPGKNKGRRNNGQNAEAF